MTERMRVVVDDNELKALIPLLDELIIKKTELRGEQLPMGLDEITGATAATKTETEAVIDNLDEGLNEVQIRAEYVAEYAITVMDKITLEMIATEQLVTATSRDALLQLFEVEAQTDTLQDRVRDLPSIDRATRMILLRIPGLREVMRLLYVIKLQERTLRLGTPAVTAKTAKVAVKVGVTVAKLMVDLKAVEAEAIAVEVATRASIARTTADIQIAESQAATSIASIRGPVTAAITMLIYAMMANQWLQNRQDRMEARLDAMEREMDQRYITIEEALRGYASSPEKYRATVSP